MTRRFLKVALAVLLIQAFVVLSADALYLSVNKIGEGSTSPAAGQAHFYAWAWPVTLTATPAPGWVFDHWEGAFYTESTSKKITMWDDYRATAVFRPAVSAPENALVRYVGKYDSGYNLADYDEDAHFGWDKHTLILTSQHYRSSAEVDRPLWQHALGIIRPWFAGSQSLLMIGGGDNEAPFPEELDDDYSAIAILYNLTYVEVGQVPNQPLVFVDDPNNYREEDDILAYSMDKYLTTGDDYWPVHSAMAKAAVRAMDGVQEHLPGIDEFLVLGGSKRGWATYLTAAVGDPRVKQIAPLSIDINNMSECMRHQWECYGFWAPAVQPFVDFDIFCRLNSLMGQNLETIVDPYTYFSKFTMPKFVAVSAGDQFFLPDSSRYSYSQLPGPKWLRYSVNTDHKQSQDDTVLNGLIWWANAQLDGNSVPNINWTFEPDGSIRVVTGSSAQGVKLWQATNSVARDFRLESIGAAWTSTDLSNQGNNTYIGYCPPPAQGWTAFLVEVDYGNDFKLTSEVRVTPDTLPYFGTGCL